MTVPRGPLLLGIDGGGTKTIALLATLDGEIAGRGEAGPANYQQVGVEAAGAALDASLAAAFAESGREFLPPAAACVGLAGVGRPEDREMLLRWAEQRLPGVPLLLVNDAALVLAAGTPQGWGVGLICGTGSIAVAAVAGGRVARAGGWGPVLGDEGSAHAIGRAALRAVMRAYDGRGPDTTLTGAILGQWQLPEPPALVERVYRQDLTVADIARLAPLVDLAAARGDAVAAEIVAGAGEELALTIDAALRALNLAGSVPCALAGGLIINGSALRAAFLDAARRRDLHLEPVTLVPLPAQGAIRLAQQVYEKKLRER